MEVSNMGSDGDQVKGNVLYNYDALTDYMMAYSLELVEGAATSVSFWVVGANNTSNIPYLDVWFFGESGNELGARHIVGLPCGFPEVLVDSGRLLGIRKIKIRANGQFRVDNFTVKRG
ncbi:hypothetical protein ACYZTM_21060 [Pseudomonas sp. MDT2-39-1]